MYEHHNKVKRKLDIWYNFLVVSGKRWVRNKYCASAAEIILSRQDVWQY